MASDMAPEKIFIPAPRTARLRRAFPPLGTEGAKAPLASNGFKPAPCASSQNQEVVILSIQIVVILSEAKDLLFPSPTHHPILPHPVLRAIPASSASQAAPAVSKRAPDC